MNNLAATLANEEPEVTSISIRPGWVDTEMHRVLREDYRIPRFIDIYTSGKLLNPEQPGHVMAKLVLDAPKSLSGRFLTYVYIPDSRGSVALLMSIKYRWNDEQLAAFQ
jgi:hypothetical protein